MFWLRVNRDIPNNKLCTTQIKIRNFMRFIIYVAKFIEVRSML